MRTSRGLAYGIAVIAILLSSCVMAGVLYYLHHEREVMRYDMRKDAQAFARIAENHLTLSIQHAQLVLDQVPDQITEQIPDNKLIDLASLLQRHQDIVPFLTSLSVMDERGQIIHSSNPRNAGHTIDAPSQSALNAPLSNVLVWQGRDLVDGQRVDANERVEHAKTQTDTLHFLTITRSITRPKQPAYTVIAVLNTHYFNHYLQRILTQSSDQVVLLNYQRQLVAHSTPIESTQHNSSLTYQLGQIWHDDELFQSVLVGNKEFGIIPTDEDQAVVFRASSKLPLLVRVELTFARYDAEWSLIQRSGVIITMLLILLIVMVAWVLWRTVLALYRTQAIITTQLLDIADKEQKVSSIVNTAPNPILTMNHDGVILSMNHAAIILFQLPLHLNVSEGMVEADLHDVLNMNRYFPLWSGCVDRVLDAQHPIHFVDTTLSTTPSELTSSSVLYIQSYQQVLIPIEMSVSHVKNTHQDFFIVVILDISQRKLYENALKQVSERFKRAIDGSNDGLWEYDFERGTTYFSDRFCELLGFTDIAYPQTLDDFVALIEPASQATFHQELQQRIVEPSRGAIDLRIQTCRDGYRWYRIRGMAIKNDHNLPLGFSGVLRDIHEQKVAEEQLRLHRDHLDEMVKAQTQELIAASERATAANIAKTEFLANMSHELRTPMHAILSFAKLGLQKTNSDLSDAVHTKLNRYFDNIYGSGQRLLVLVNDLLDLSKLEAGKMSFEFSLHNLKTLADEVLRELRPLLLDKKLRYELKLPDELPLVRCDSGRMSQVIRNLLSNAIKFSPAEQMISLTFKVVTLFNHTAQQGVLLKVRDRGLGVPADELELIFDKFVQSSKTKSGAGGTGLGLAICREIVAGHGGWIRARNHEDGGAVFEVFLPFST